MAMTLYSAPAMADEMSSYDTFAKERFQLRLRGIGVIPKNDGGSASIGGNPEPDNAPVPEFDITYFFTDHIAAELILAVSPHDLTLKNRPAGAADLDLGDTWLLPPTLTLQYHFTPEKEFSPYLGAGINYSLPFNEEHSSSTTALEADGSFGYAVQAGFDYWLNDNWGLNLDVKKIWVDVDAKVNNTIDAEVEIDPLIVGAGLSYRF